MGLQLKANLYTDDCLNLIFNDQTGNYTTTNTGGWNSPNISLTTATAASVAITTPSGTTYTFNVFVSGLPSYDINSTYSISYSDLGFTSSLADGIYTAVYTVNALDGSGEPAVYTVTKSTYITCNLQCCVDTMLINIDDWDCDCSKDAKDNYLKAFGILQQIYHAIECGDLDTASNLSTVANKLCKNSGCSSCS